MAIASWRIVKELNITDRELKERCDALKIKMKLHMNTSTGFQYAFFSQAEYSKIRNYSPKATSEAVKHEWEYTTKPAPVLKTTSRKPSNTTLKKTVISAADFNKL